MATTATNHWKLGLFVLLAVGATLGTLFWLGARRFRRESFPAISYFDESVQGLDVGSPVKFRGVTVGTVTDITIAPDHRHVQVSADMYVDALVRLGLRTRAPKSGEEFIPPNLRVQLASAGITGVRFIQTDFFDPERYPPPKDRKSTRLNSSHVKISYAVFCLKKKTTSEVKSTVSRVSITLNRHR